MVDIDYWWQYKIQNSYRISCISINIDRYYLKICDFAFLYFLSGILSIILSLSFSDMAEENQKSPHILNASSNLLGLCFVVLTSLKLLRVSQRTLIDEFTSGATLLFMLSCILSFLSIRGSLKRSQRLENIADILFLCGLGLLFLTALLFSLNVIS